MAITRREADSGADGEPELRLAFPSAGAAQLGECPSEAVPPGPERDRGRRSESPFLIKDKKN